jgi:SAM-dependent methyltransferase
MDDRTFDDETALQWIKVIEEAKTSIRDGDIYPRLQSWMKIGSLTNLLEIGSGQGVCSDKIELSGGYYTGLEPSPRMTERARELYSRSNRSFVLGNAYSLPFKSNSFDGVFSILVWHLLGDLDKANHELSRVLKPGGRFLIITANPGSYFVWKSFYSDLKLEGKRLEGSMTFKDGTQTHDVLFLHTQDELLTSLRNVSLEVNKVEVFRPSPKEQLELLVSIEGQKL